MYRYSFKIMWNWKIRFYRKEFGNSENGNEIHNLIKDVSKPIIDEETIWAYFVKRNCSENQSDPCTSESELNLMMKEYLNIPLFERLSGKNTRLYYHYFTTLIEIVEPALVFLSLLVNYDDFKRNFSFIFRKMRKKKKIIICNLCKLTVNVNWDRGL